MGTEADARPADPDVAGWKARASLTALPGRGSVAVGTDGPEAAGAAGKRPEPEGAAGAEAELDPLLCYACATTLRGRKEAEMPPFVGDEVRRRVAREEMRAEIADFLLE